MHLIQAIERATSSISYLHTPSIPNSANFMSIFIRYKNIRPSCLQSKNQVGNIQRKISSAKASNKFYSFCVMVLIISSVPICFVIFFSCRTAHIHTPLFFCLSTSFRKLEHTKNVNGDSTQQKVLFIGL